MLSILSTKESSRFSAFGIKRWKRDGPLSSSGRKAKRGLLMLMIARVGIGRVNVGCGGMVSSSKMVERCKAVYPDKVYCQSIDALGLSS